MRAYGDDYVGTARILINGGRPMNNDYSVDGITSTMPGALPEQFVTVYPGLTPARCCRKLIVQTNAFSAEFGRTGGGVINTVIKSGTNKFHGTVYEFLRNSKMDANNFFANRNGVPLGSFKRNQFGETLGGPALPNRLFFFFSYEGLRQRALQSRTDTQLGYKPHISDQLRSTSAYYPAVSSCGPRGRSLALRIRASAPVAPSAGRRSGIAD